MTQRSTQLLIGASVLVLGTLAALGARRIMAEGRRHATRPIRPAGPRAMDDPPRDWDVVDEQSDQSFPASDPPGNY